MYDTQCVFPFFSPLCLRLSEEKSCMDRHYCPYCRVNTCIYHKPTITHVTTHTEVMFLCSKCLVLLLLCMSEVKWL